MGFEFDALGLHSHCRLFGILSTSPRQHGLQVVCMQSVRSVTDYLLHVLPLVPCFHCKLACIVVTASANRFCSRRIDNKAMLTSDMAVHENLSEAHACKMFVWSAGAVWADQLFHWSRYRQQWLTFPLLILVTAVFGLLGLIPLMNNFAHIAGFVAGFLMCTVAVLNTRVCFSS